jgi:diaminohydroxyphosphoribosylaminopyrimidine deaminase/5-amino-6-(5-phosphoribosylamino)uracil reductase
MSAGFCRWVYCVCVHCVCVENSRADHTWPCKPLPLSLTNNQPTHPPTPTHPQKVFWECGGTLAAPTISAGVIHKVMAFVAPKIIGGERAPCPVGELGFVEMTQVGLAWACLVVGAAVGCELVKRAAGLHPPNASLNRHPQPPPTAANRQAVNLVETQYIPSGPDILITGYLPSSGGLLALEQSLSYPEHKPGSLLPGAWGAQLSAAPAGKAAGGSGEESGDEAAGVAGAAGAAAAAGGLPRNKGNAPRVVNFYKAWDEWGALGNFSPHPIVVEDDGSSVAASSSGGGGSSGGAAWPSVEHYYQAAKFSGVDREASSSLIAAIRAAESPEEAARLGRRAERQQPDLVRPDWQSAKQSVMRRALRAKYSQHAGPRRMLLSTAGDAAAGVPAARLVEASPNDTFWGQGYSGSGTNTLGRLLMELRDELAAEEEAALARARHQQQQASGQQQQLSGAAT